MRLFIGLELPSDIKQYIHEYLSPLKSSPKGWENPHDYHQTLLFIGEASQEECELIIDRLKDFNFNSFSLTLGEIQFFPRRVMFLGFETSDELMELQNKIEILYPEWGKPHGRTFVPHVTLKRFQRYEHADLKSGLGINAFQNKMFFVNEICLFKSEKDELNRKYHVIFRKKL